jgi:hypothetical protein
MDADVKELSPKMTGLLADLKRVDEPGRFGALALWVLGAIVAPGSWPRLTSSSSIDLPDEKKSLLVRTESSVTCRALADPDPLITGRSTASSTG